MANASVTWSGVNKLITKLNASRAQTVSATVEAMHEATAKTQQRAQAIAPVRTAYMKNNIHAEAVKESGGAVTGTVRARAEYSSYVEFGTYKMKAQPYMRPAVAQTRQELPKIVASKLRKVVKP